MAWLLLLTINTHHSSEEELKGKNEPLKAHIRQLEKKITSLSGQTTPPSDGTFPLKLSLEREKDLGLKMHLFARP